MRPLGAHTAPVGEARTPFTVKSAIRQRLRGRNSILFGYAIPRYVAASFRMAAYFRLARLHLGCPIQTSPEPSRLRLVAVDHEPEALERRQVSRLRSLPTGRRWRGRDPEPGHRQGAARAG